MFQGFLCTFMKTVVQALLVKAVQSVLISTGILGWGVWKGRCEGRGPAHTASDVRPGHAVLVGCRVVSELPPE